MLMAGGHASGRACECARPAAMCVDDFIDLLHQTNSFRQGNDNLLVMRDVVFSQHAAFTVFEPFLANLITTDVEVPHGLEHVAEAFGLSLVHP